MDNTLEKKSDFLKIKSKFFINRLVTYFSFFLAPIWLQHTVQLNLFFQSLTLLFYMFFMLGQWYLLGKEIDHRLKIYYRANSSMDRIIYRILNGNIFIILFFNILYMLPGQITEIGFWVFFISVGLFYSWPTRGKIIEESMAGQFGEFRFLDNFERTVLVMIAAMFLVSLPELPLFQNIEALKLYFDPREEVHSMIWNFLSVNYLPFNNYSKLFNLAWSFHFYIYGIGIFLLAFYCVLRFFFARRLAILGIFAVVSSWSFSRVLAQDFLASYTHTFPLLFVWALFWSSKSSTYRSGLLTGLVCATGAMINVAYAFLFPPMLIGMWSLFSKNKTDWYKKQWLKYNALGGFILVAVAFSHSETALVFDAFNFVEIKNIFLTFFTRKAFYSVGLIGLVMMVFYFLGRKKKRFSLISFDDSKISELLFCLALLMFMAIIINPIFVTNFTAMWILTIFSLIPLEWIFQSISRLRSKRNLIYVLYILVCLLDSHFEGRVRIIGKMFLEDEIFKFINQI
ncbi:MAG: hypothetical protein KC478_00935 [Bacteriovoracaceae bacterium]|nr:hypothetical protein [Bacteriovoracaceae bacterium]